MTPTLLVLTAEPSTWEEHWVKQYDGMIISLVKDYEYASFQNLATPKPTMRVTRENVYDPFVLYRHAVMHRLEMLGNSQAVQLDNLRFACVYDLPGSPCEGVIILTWDDPRNVMMAPNFAHKIEVVDKFLAKPPTVRLANLLAKFGAMKPRVSGENTGYISP